MKRRRQIIGSLAVIGGGLLLVIGSLALPQPWAPSQQYGVSFSAPHATGIGLNWQETYQALLTDLGVRHLRLAAYWNELEPRPGEYDFSSLDYQLDQAAEHNATVTLAVGRKVPRWPECHEPAWSKTESEAYKQAKVLALIEAVVVRYRTHPALEQWQVENEPLLEFGICPPLDRDFLAREIALVRSHDSRPILITDSGELNWWLDAAQYGDIVGTTLYRTVFSRRTERPFHYDYLFPAWLYRAKARLVKSIRGHDVLIAELQGEPWGRAPFTELTAAERTASMSAERLAAVQRFAARTQFPRAYWWGVEYWYWEKEVNGNPAVWETARTFFVPDQRTP